MRTLNQFGYHELERGGALATRTPLAVAGDDAEARRLVADLIDRMGYDPVDAGSLVAASQLEPETPIFEGRLRRDEMERQLA